MEIPEPISYAPGLNGGYTVVLDGDSRTDGWNCKNEYPYLNLMNFGDTIKLQKVSYGGASSWELNHRQDDCYKTKIDQGGVNLIVLWIGANDITVHNKSAEGVFENINQYCSDRRSEGWKVLVCTEISLKGHRYELSYDAERQKLNDLIRANWMTMADGIADLGRSYTVGRSGAYSDKLYFCDGIHLTNRGTHEVAQIIERAIKNCLGIPLLTQPNTKNIISQGN